MNNDENRNLGFGVLVRDNKHNWCKGMLSLPSFSTYQICFSVCWDGEVFEEENPRERTDIVPIKVFNQTDCTASEAQNAACFSLIQIRAKLHQPLYGC